MTTTWIRDGKISLKLRHYVLNYSEPPYFETSTSKLGSNGLGSSEQIGRALYIRSKLANLDRNKSDFADWMRIFGGTLKCVIDCITGANYSLG